MYCGEIIHRFHDLEDEIFVAKGELEHAKGFFEL